ncbi:MAG: hypothetical protein HWN80_10850 [Candidatus Lokiarchaeota archaeon]|nr:hypothetical protein [Candidatus Lokiarchaeota archaeon]
MEHTNLSIENDKNLIEKVLDDIDMRYIVLFLYVIRNDLFRDLNDTELIESYEKVLILDEIFKNNILNLWNNEFIEVAVDLGLFKNIRSMREFQQKEGDFIIRLGEETVTIENDTISVPDHTLFLIINKKFKFLTRRNFNSALIKLKGLRCETSNMIHPFVSEIGDHDYVIPDDIYYILDQYGNIYQAIKIEITIEGIYQRYLEIQEKIDEFIDIFEPKLRTKPVLKKIHEAIQYNKDIIKHLKHEKIELPDKFDHDEIDNENSIYKDWNSKMLLLLNYSFQMKQLENKILEIKECYSGKGKKFNYLEFIEKVSFNEDNIVNTIQSALIKLREELIEANNELEKLTKKELKLLNLDFERYLITNQDD